MIFNLMIESIHGDIHWRNLQYLLILLAVAPYIQTGLAMFSVVLNCVNNCQLLFVLAMMTNVMVEVFDESQRKKTVYQGEEKWNGGYICGKIWL